MLKHDIDAVCEHFLSEERIFGSRKHCTSRIIRKGDPEIWERDLQEIQTAITFGYMGYIWLYPYEPADEYNQMCQQSSHFYDDYKTSLCIVM